MWNFGQIWTHERHPAEYDGFDWLCAHWDISEAKQGNKA